MAAEATWGEGEGGGGELGGGVEEARVSGFVEHGALVPRER
jgi:hypothetical protein